MSRDSLNVTLAVLSVLSLAVAGSVLVDRMRAPAAARRVTASPMNGERRVTLEIAGMTCSGCATRVTEEIKNTPGVVACDVDPPSGRAVVWCSKGVDDTSLVSAVKRAGRSFAATILAR